MVATVSPRAENPSHNKWLPAGSDTFNAENFYFGVGSIIALPIIFDGKPNYSGTGVGIGVEAGYDWAGWLFGVRYSHLIYGPGGSIHGFTHDIISVEVSKLFTKYHIPFFPTWLDMRLKFGVGADFSGGRYYKNAVSESVKLTSEEHFATMVFSPALFFEYTQLPLVNLFLGANFDFTFDVRGVFAIPSILLGIRTSIGKSKAAIKAKSEQTAIAIEESEEKIEELKKQLKEIEEYEEMVFGSVLFDPDSATFDRLTPSQQLGNYITLSNVVNALKKNPAWKITVKGYANSITSGPLEQNILVPLSLERALLVKQMLVDNGIEPERINVVAKGGEDPLENKKRTSWKNRRVEFVLEK